MSRVKNVSSIHYNPFQLVEAWNSLGDAKAVAKRFKMEKDAVIQIASQLRSKGIFMRKLKKGPSEKINYKELAKFSQKFKKLVEDSPPDSLH